MAAGFQPHLPCRLLRSLRTLITSYHTLLIKLLTHGGELAVYGAMSPCCPDPTIHGIHGKDHKGAPHLSVNFPSRPPSPLARSPDGGVLREGSVCIRGLSTGDSSLQDRGHFGQEERGVHSLLCG